MSNTYFKNLTANKNNLELFECAKVTDRIRIETMAMTDIPAGENPFHHDLSSMGASVSPAFMAMYSSSFKEKHGHMYLVNNGTGQRTKLIFVPEDPRPKKLLRISNSEVTDGKFHKIGFELSRYMIDARYSDCYISHREVDKLGDFAAPVPPHVGSIMTATPPIDITTQPVYWVANGVGILIYPGVVHDLNGLIDYHDGDFVEDENLLMAYNRLRDTVGAVDPVSSTAR